MGRPVCAQVVEVGKRTPQWIAGPAADLLVGCGAWTAPLIGLTYLVSTRRLVDLGLVFYALALFCNNPHYAATIDRAYGNQRDFRTYRLFTVHATLLLAAVGLLVHRVPAGVPWIVTLYLTWSPWHYTGQNFGLAILWARRNGAAPTRTERNVLYGAFLASYLMWFLWLQSTDSTDANLLTLGISGAVTSPLRAGLFGVFVAGSTWSMSRLARRAGVRAMSGAMVLLSTQLLWLVVPTLLDFYQRQPLPPAYYTTSVLAFMHCAQYLWVTAYYARRETEAGSRGGAATWDGRRYYIRLVLGGIALFTAGPWLISSVFHHDLTDSLLIFAAVVNIHHFILDGAIWKLRDGRVARLLLGSRIDATRARLADGEGRDRAWRWLNGVSRSPAVRTAAIATLVSFALADQVQNLLTAERTTAGRLAWAGDLNRHDTRVLVRHAALLADAGRVHDAMAELEQAIALNPRHASALRMLGSLLVQSGRYRDAVAHYQRAELVVRPDLTTLINTAVLSGQAGDLTRAEERLLRALRMDPDYPEAHLNLAEVYFARARFDEAIAHYQRFLTLTPRLELTGRRLRLRAAVLLKVADAGGKAGRPDAARAAIEEARALASNDPELAVQLRSEPQTIAHSVSPLPAD
jgi:tetratricopeptide (TPR) repeat protein